MIHNDHYLLIKYRKDIDGLRAIAILAVILYHTFPNFCQGGFLGVDIFFVISGYLISLILFKNFKNKNFYLYDFYARRIIRIFPALILVLSFSLIFSWFLLISSEYLLLAKHTRSSTIFLVNFVLAKEAGYFDVSSYAKPLMHLWSLSIEEQFYICWPLLLYFIIKNKINIILICISVILLSLFISIEVFYKDPIRAFYFPLCRFWELISGGLLAFVNISNYGNKFKKIKILINYSVIRNITGLLGVIINFYSILFFSHESFSGWHAILPVIGTSFIIVTGEDSWINTVLSNKILVNIGLISYPLYLWHWSFLSFSFILEGKISNNTAIFILLISVVLSWFTYKFIEKPIRLAKNRNFTVLILIALLASVAFFSQLIIVNRGYSQRRANMSNSMSSLAQEDKNFLSLKINCSFPFNRRAFKNEREDLYCISNTDKPKFLVIGDSHVLSFVHSAEIQKDMDIIMVYLTSQPPFRDSTSYGISDNKEKRVQKLKLFNQYIDNILEYYSSIEYVILVSRGSIYISGNGFGIEKENLSLQNWKLEHGDNNKITKTNQEVFVEGYVKMTRYLLSKGKKVIFAIDFPELGMNPKLCLTRLINFSIKENCLIDKNTVKIRQREYRELVDQIQQKVASLIVYDPIDTFCNQNHCYGKRNSIIYYGDDNHLNLEGSKILNNHFKNWLFKEGKLLGDGASSS